ncbi:metal dependent phosphohydrolase [Shewanella denitrificans OS217]|uniref:Metal dependent phosphohydrolase n=1 Tax=Shewanella denitrificans (strain OS217 / ATCC BAA-1090 / DSM 15013) TaxID=318161 RepID=Q12LJ7_SHEDO|nr:HD-GYP domain-containing protein [Shewanella denitrificans]ABE55679.1 metal dependent phosphohydrolase [Shewanella denitrificans OS217]
MLVEHDISDVRVGMYIIEITVPKNKFRLAKQGWLDNERIIDALKSKSVEKVLIDASKTRIVADQNATTPSPSVATPSVTTKKGTKTSSESVKPKAASVRTKYQFNQEVIKAKQVFAESKAIQAKLFHNAQRGLPLEMESVCKITSESTDLIFNNPNALACVLNIRNKDEYLLEHSVSVSILMTMFALYLKIDRDIVNQLAIGAFLHDVGKIMVPDNILNKPGKLTDDEFFVMKSHARHSVSIMRKTPGISAISMEVAGQHHEKLNGKGYPLGLKGDKISLYGRMSSICDIFDALTATRCYKQGYPQVKCFGILRKLAENNELDIDLVDKFIKCMGVYPVGAVVQLDSNRLAIVESHNIADPIRPNVRPFYRLDPKLFEKGLDVDLSSAADEQIVKCVRADDFELDMQQIIEFLAQEA